MPILEWLLFTGLCMAGAFAFCAIMNWWERHAAIAQFQRDIDNGTIYQSMQENEKRLLDDYIQRKGGTLK